MAQVSINGADLGNVSPSRSKYVPSSLLEWLNDPSNKSNPLYSQALALSQRGYNGPGEGMFDWLFRAFGPTASDNAYSNYKQSQDDEWLNLLGQIYEYNVNLPSNLAQLNKNAGYNVDLSGDLGSMDISQDNPVSPVDFSGVTTGREILENTAGGLLSAFSTAMSLFNMGISVKNDLLKGDLLETEVSDRVRASAINYAQSKLGDYESVAEAPLYSVGMSLDDFISKGRMHRKHVKGQILQSLETGDFPYSNYSRRSRERFKEYYKNYVNSDEFDKDLYNFYVAREKAYQEGVKTSSQPTGVSYDDNGFSSALDAFKPLYKLEMQALEGDFNRRIYEGKSSQILFNEKEFNWRINEATRDVLEKLQEDADNGDKFAQTLLFTMVTDPRYFKNIHDGLDLITDFIPGKGLFKGLSKSISKRAGKRVKKTSDILNN